MKRFRFIAVFSVLLLYSCEKLIDVDLNETNPVIVIEGTMTGEDNSAEVKISQTTSYFNTNPMNQISGATVYITDERAHKFTLQENDKGQYIAEGFYPHLGYNYTLSVEIDGKIYTSESKLHEAVKIDSLSVVYNQGYSFLAEGYNVNLYFRDPPNIRNFYRLRIYINGVLENDTGDMIFFDDKNSDGSFLAIEIKSKIFAVGDFVTYELESLDEAAYNYLDAISEIVDGSSAGTLAPANPEPNFSNGALGYFSAYTSDSKTVIIKD